MVVVEEGNVLHHVKREGELSGMGNILGNMSGEYTQGKSFLSRSMGVFRALTGCSK